MRFSLSSLFGANATQTANELTISKSDLATVGLTPGSANTAESLLVAVLLLARKQIEGNLALVLDPNGNPIDYDQSSLFEAAIVQFWRTVWVNGKQREILLVNIFFDPDSSFGSPIDPNI